MNNATPHILIARAIKIVLETRRIGYALKLIEHAKKIAEDDQIEDVEYLALAALDQVFMVMRAEDEKSKPTTHNEYGYVQSWFKEKYQEFFPCAELEKVVAGRYVPDFLVKMQDGVVVPVECKKNFNARALRQLRAYMKHFGVSQGIAVASKLTTELPDGVIFIERVPD